MDPDCATDEERIDRPSYMSRAYNALADLARPFFSKTAQKTYLALFFLVQTATCMIIVSAIAYGILYYKFIPQISLERVVHLQFGDTHPWGTTFIGPGLISLQPYDVSVELELPRTPSNLATGNFMLDLALSHSSMTTPANTNTSTRPILQSRRPAILTFNSALIDTATKLTFMPLYVTGWRREAERLSVPMMEQVEFARGSRNTPDLLRLEVRSSEQMQFYGVKVAFKARFTGLRWMMYNWKLTSFVVFSFLFWSTSMSSAAFCWLLLASVPRGGTTIEVKAEDDEEPSIKKEEPSEPTSLLEFPSESSRSPAEVVVKKEDDYQADGESDDSDTVAGPSGDSGTGTGRESAESRGIQRRRSRQFKEEQP